ncbi:MAG: amidohydrolase family protein, partial [Acidimicrobiia bacterium]
MSLWVGNVVHDDAAVDVLVDGGTITEIGPDLPARPGDRLLDGGGRALTPGLVNGHGHAAMTLFRGYGDDLPLNEWLEARIWPAEARLARDDVYWGTRLACLEMIRSGTTRFWDMYWYQFEVARAVVDSGIRGAVSQVFLAFDGAPDEARPDAAAEGLAHLGEFGDRVTPCLGPHAIYTVEESVLVTIGEMSTAGAVPIQIHLSETEDEVRDCIAQHGCRPAEYLDRVGMLTPDTILSHGVWLDRGELDLIAHRGSTIVTNPVSNMKLTVGRAFPYPTARAAG